jgi:hypothetical protein
MATQDTNLRDAGLIRRRTARRAVPIILFAAAFIGVATTADAADLPVQGPERHQHFGYEEECNNEGCDNEEKSELFWLGTNCLGNETCEGWLESEVPEPPPGNGTLTTAGR